VLIADRERGILRLPHGRQSQRLQAIAKGT